MRNTSNGYYTAVGIYAGYQLYSVIHLLPLILEELNESVPIHLLVLAGFIVLVFSQIELGKRLSYVSASSAIRDSVFGQSISFIIFVMAPQSLWLFLAFICWLLAFSALQISLGRWTLLSADADERTTQTIFSLGGFCGGIVLAKSVAFWGGSTDFLIYLGLGITAAVSFMMYIFSKSGAGYTSMGQTWFFRDLRQDYALQALAAVSLAMGLMMGKLIFFQAHIGPAVIGVLALSLFGKTIFRNISPEKACRYSAYLCGASLLVDTLIWNELFLSSVVLSFSAALIYAAIRIDAFHPKTMMTSGDRLAFHNTGLAIGIIIEGILPFFNLDISEYLWSNAILIGGIGYLLSFHPDQRFPR